MVILIIHHDAGVCQELHAALSRGGLGPCLTVSSEAEVHGLHRTAGPAVEVVVTSVEWAPLVAEWREVVGPVKAAFLAKDNLRGWAERLPGELLLPGDPLPVATVVGWIRALGTGRQLPSPVPVGPKAPAPFLLPFMAGPEATGFGVVAAPREPELVAEAEAEAEVSPEEGRPVVGDYELLEILRETEETVTYRALQRSVQRVVILERLRTGPASRPELARAFRAMVRAQAAVVHPRIVAVYEAQEQDGRIFFTREWVPGRSLEQVRGQRQRLGQEVLLGLLEAAAEAIEWFEGHGLARRELTPADVVLGRDGLPRVANLALGAASSFLDEGAEMMELLGAAQAVLEVGRPAAEFERVMERVTDRSSRGVRTWRELGPVLAEARRQVVEARPSKTRRLALGSEGLVLEQERRRKRRQWLVAGAVALTGLAVFHWLPYWRAPRPRIFGEMVRIPGGAFIYQAGEMRELPTYWIGKHEVSIGQYAEFLEALERAPGKRYDHPRQPAAKAGHRPAGWDGLVAAARRGGLWRGQPVDVNCPVTGVDYWDAWAYASWRGQRLPTELEWEKAGRGTDGRLYPWGRDPEAPRANTGADFGAGRDRGRKDGHAGWAPVDSFAGTDVSPYGVVGLAGNVSEWTDSTMLDPEVLDKQVPVVRGGSYAMRPTDLLHRRPVAGAAASEATLGFRTASDRSP